MTLSARALNRMEKERRILDAALKVFASAGFSGASMDAIAEKAGVSKPTLYQYFGDKDGLFAAVMGRGGGHLLEPLQSLGGAGLVATLHRFAWHYADFVLRPDMLSLARLVIGEVQRFPQIGRAYQSAGPDRVLRGIMEFLNDQRAQGRLAFDDAELAAEDLWALVLSAPRNQALHVPDQPIARAEVARYVGNGLRVFLRAYSTDPRADLAELETLIRQSGP